MKKVIIHLLLYSILFFGCRNEPVQPEERPAGYQDDIAWPSLSDSPWPMYHADPQNTVSSKDPGILSGNIDWSFQNSLECNTGVAVSKDSLIIVPYECSLKAFTFDGHLKWSIDMPSETETAPVIGSDGTIYCCYLDIIAVNSNGTIKWRYSTGKAIWNWSMNIGKDGTLFFVDNQNTLYSISSQGALKWKSTNSLFFMRYHSAFSPDGNTLYLTGNEPTLIALDVQTGSIKWTFGALNTNNIAPLVDDDGNIYISSKDPSYSSTAGMFCLHPDRTVRWFFPNYQNTNKEANYSSPALDKNGNLYFAGDTLYSLDFYGKLRWEKGLSNFTVTALIVDASGNIYVTLAETGSAHELVCFDTNGNIRFRLIVAGCSTISSPAIAFGRIYLPTQGKSFYSIK